MNRKLLKSLEYKHVRLIPRPRVLVGGQHMERDWEWFVSRVASGIVVLSSHHWSIEVSDDNFYSFQSGCLLMLGRLHLYDGGKGYDIVPIEPSCRGLVVDIYRAVEKRFGKV